ncbi:MAG: bifunctional adenosylcobinamide kinase/adenosylcobinamide-phosphate guanylyltransferase [Clostridiales bacterium]|jgi:adenosylcobinamide kinase/adenosylcobinamide-phosphate guanylyltransferase|nr:bifunctional adenosylcobinamide kinase/adenosylcobinamide-phosphate guanylyltransferase [Clostridiales bacterium]
MVLVTGGARVGKTKLAIKLCQQQGPRVLYVAAGSPVGDDIFSQEIVRRTRKQRPITWEVRERYHDLGRFLLAHGADRDAILIENMRNMVAALMKHYEYSESEFDLRYLTSSVVDEMNQMVTSAREISALVVLVTNEVNIYPHTSDFFYKAQMDILGRVNQLLAASCQDVYWLASGIPVKVK